MSIFEVTGSSDPLGLWDSIPQAVSFGVGDETTAEADTPVYRANFPGSGETASSALAEQLDSFVRVDAALGEIPSQLEGLLRRKPPKAAGGVSFALADLSPEADAGNELLALLAYADAEALGRTELEGISFGFGEAAGQALGRAKEKLFALFEQVNQDMLHFAWVETRIAEQMIARSRMGWSGEARTVWRDLIPSEHIHLHHKTLEVVSQTRNQKLRLSLTVIGCAAKMAVLMTAPGGPMLTFPAVYQYVMKVLEQANHLHTLQASGGKKT